VTAQAVILAIEDEPRNAALLRAALRPDSFELHIETSLADGRAWLAERVPGVILLDRHLPDGDALELVRELRAGPHGPAWRILLVTASVLDADREAAAEAGCDAFIAKPINVRGLIEEIRRQLSR